MIIPDGNMLSILGSTGSLTTDAHIAALALETGGTIYSSDTDFLGFHGVKAVNPIIA
ncbi:MAG: hypothetical protein SVR04_17785 [Spirochaetota bacterium]|nr:hypothetical protein [Spirochaetota bacterium]